MRHNKNDEQSLAMIEGIIIQSIGSNQADGMRFLPEDSPFQTLFADITHLCDMSVKRYGNPDHHLDDLPLEWFFDVLSRLANRTRIRLVGSEPTRRDDLIEIVSNIKNLGHLPIIHTDGLAFADLSQVQSLKAAGLRDVYLSFNGGLSDALYQTIDGRSCAKEKLSALDN